VAQGLLALLVLRDYPDRPGRQVVGLVQACLETRGLLDSLVPLVLRVPQVRLDQVAVVVRRVHRVRQVLRDWLGRQVLAERLGVRVQWVQVEGLAP